MAALMNEHFVCIKVDREERPDLDDIYMQATQAMTGHGGWPMTVFLTPAGRAVLRRHLLPARGPPRHAELPARAPGGGRRVGEPAGQRDARPRRRMRELYAASTERTRATGALDEALLVARLSSLVQRYEPRFGGFDGAPKFPPTMTLDFLLRHWARTGEAQALEMVTHTLRRMARGGIYDQVGGGFARYSVDAQWLVPHFEKMLYDNALLVRLGAHLWQATRDHEFRRVTEETVGWLAREMTSPEGGLLLVARRRQRGPRGALLRVGRRRARSAARRGRGAGERVLGRHRGRQLRGTQHPVRAARAGGGRGGAGRHACASCARRSTARRASCTTRASAACGRRATRRSSPLERADAARRGRGGARLRRRGAARDGGAGTASSSSASWCATTACCARTRTGVAKIPGFLEDYAAVGLGRVRAVPAHLRPGVARARAPTRRRDRGALLGRRGPGVLRHGQR